MLESSATSVETSRATTEDPSDQDKSGEAVSDELTSTVSWREGDASSPCGERLYLHVSDGGDMGRA